MCVCEAIGDARMRRDDTLPKVIIQGDAILEKSAYKKLRLESSGDARL